MTCWRNLFLEPTNHTIENYILAVAQYCGNLKYVRKGIRLQQYKIVAMEAITSITNDSYITFIKHVNNFFGYILNDEQKAVYQEIVLEAVKMNCYILCYVDFELYNENIVFEASKRWNKTVCYVPNHFDKIKQNGIPVAILDGCLAYPRTPIVQGCLAYPKVVKIDENTEYIRIYLSKGKYLTLWYGPEKQTQLDIKNHLIIEIDFDKLEICGDTKIEKFENINL